MSLSPVPRFDRNDYGIVFYASATNTGTYVDYLGQTRDILQLPNNTPDPIMMDAAIESAYFHVGAASTFDLQVEVKLSGGATVDLGLVGKFADANTLSGLEEFCELITEINTTGLGQAIHSFAADAKVVLQTSNLSGITTGAIRITPTFDDETCDVVVRLRVLA